MFNNVNVIKKSAQKAPNVRQLVFVVEYLPEDRSFYKVFVLNNYVTDDAFSNKFK